LRRELVVDTDLASFTGAILGVLVAAAFAAIEWWSVLHLRAPQYHVRWHDYVVAAIAGWALLMERERTSQFFVGLLLTIELGRIATAWLRLSDANRRAISLWSSLTMAVLFSAVVVFGMNWLWQKIRTAKFVDATNRSEN
jgi:hypothetical protein